MTYPTISISLTSERVAKISSILRALREQDETISRSEAIGRAIDLYYTVVCPLETEELEPADIAK